MAGPPARKDGIIMTGLSTGKSSRRTIVLTIACLLIAVGIAAGLYWFAVIQPQQNVPQAPTNGDPSTCYNNQYDCMKECHKPGADPAGIAPCDQKCMTDYDTCMQNG